MKKIAFVLVTMACTYTGFSQTGTPTAALDSVAAIAIHYLQAKQSDSLYALAGENFKSKIGADDFKSISENQIFPINDFKQVSFVRNINGINKYKIEGTPPLQLFIGLDAGKKLETLLIQPYSED